MVQNEFKSPRFSKKPFEAKIKRLIAQKSASVLSITDMPGVVRTMSGITLLNYESNKWARDSETK